MMAFLTLTLLIVFCTQFPAIYGAVIAEPEREQNVPTPNSSAGSSIVAEIPVGDGAFYSLKTYHGDRKSEAEFEGYKGSYGGASGIVGQTDGSVDTSTLDTKEYISSFSNVHSGSFASSSGVNSFGYAGTQASKHGGLAPGLLFGSGSLYRNAANLNELSGIGYMGTKSEDEDGMSGTYSGAFGSGFKELKHAGVITAGSMLKRDAEDDSETAVANAQTQTFTNQDDREGLGVASSEAKSKTLGTNSTTAEVHVQTAVQTLGAGMAGSMTNAEAESLVTGESKFAATNSYSESYTIGSALAASGSEANATVNGAEPSQGAVRNDASSMSNSGFAEINGTKSLLPTESRLDGSNSRIMAANLGQIVEGPNVAEKPSKPQGSQTVGIQDSSSSGPSQTVGISQTSNANDEPGASVTQSIQSPNIKWKRFNPNMQIAQQAVLDQYKQFTDFANAAVKQFVPAQPPHLNVLNNFGLPSIQPFGLNGLQPTGYGLQYGAAAMGPGFGVQNNNNNWNPLNAITAAMSNPFASFGNHQSSAPQQPGGHNGGMQPLFTPFANQQSSVPQQPGSHNNGVQPFFTPFGNQQSPAPQQSGSLNGGTQPIVFNYQGNGGPLEPGMNYQGSVISHPNYHGVAVFSQYNSSNQGPSPVQSTNQDAVPPKNPINSIVSWIQQQGNQGNSATSANPSAKPPQRPISGNLSQGVPQGSAGNVQGSGASQPAASNQVSQAPSKPVVSNEPAANQQVSSAPQPAADNHGSAVAPQPAFSSQSSEVPAPAANNQGAEVEGGVSTQGAERPQAPVSNADTTVPHGATTGNGGSALQPPAASTQGQSLPQQPASSTQGQSLPQQPSSSNQGQALPQQPLPGYHNPLLQDSVHGNHYYNERLPSQPEAEPQSQESEHQNQPIPSIDWREQSTPLKADPIPLNFQIPIKNEDNPIVIHKAPSVSPHQTSLLNESDDNLDVNDSELEALDEYI